jgi:5-methyltetrahydrofolate--homocysteine methyltransferase
MSDFVTSLRSGKVLVMDGAMGTEIVRLTGSLNSERLERYNLADADLIRSIHRSYLDAGADVVLTNTFQVNRVEGSEQHHLWQAAIRLAHAEHPRPRYILADVGPTENLTPEIVASLLRECVNVDGILLETWTSFHSLEAFIGEVPLLVSFTYQRAEGLVTFAGATPESCAREAQRIGAVAIGANCGKEIGMDDMVEIVQRYRAVCNLPIFVRPNAGTPSEHGYPGTPESMAAGLPALLEAGIAMIGGCCGTTPEHIRQFRRVVNGWNSGGR